MRSVGVTNARDNDKNDRKLTRIVRINGSQKRVVDANLFYDKEVVEDHKESFAVDVGSTRFVPAAYIRSRKSEP